MLKFFMSLAVFFSFVSLAFAGEMTQSPKNSALQTPAKTVASPSVSVSPAASAGTAANAKAVPQGISNSKLKAFALKRNMVFINGIQFTHVSGDVYNWQAEVRNVSGAVIAGAVLMPSQYVNGSWTPMGDQQTKDLQDGTSSQAGSGSIAEGAKFKLDVLARKNGESSPLEVVGSKTVTFSAQAADLAANINISNITVTPFDNRFQWKATVTNSNAVPFTAKIWVSGHQFFNNHWEECGGNTINQLAAGASVEKSLTFWRDPTSTQFKIVLTSNNQIIKESAPVALEPINAFVVLSNVVVTKQGTVANWSATVTNNGNIQLRNVRVKTYQRVVGGQWAVASNTQNAGALAIGAGATVSNMFSCGTSTQFKVEVVASSFSENYGEIMVGTQEINF